VPQSFKSTREATPSAVIRSINYRDEVLGGMRETSCMLTKKTNSNTQFFLSASGSAENDPALLTRKELAKRLSLSIRSIDNLQRAKKISHIRLSPRCIRFHLPSVLTALRKFEVKEAGAK
jgi:hypothetical protein